ncbi:uncharacterized protein LOC135385335 isoform X2 [Ornithodoros turicata]|uniref:uncharacterized protein LOC135385335 isoform X2 n=1 Tax=Ornithodoros turicata TaxID=34597 RepID=UPI0031392301
MGLKITDRPPTPTPGNAPLTLAHLLSDPPADVQICSLQEPQIPVPSRLEPARCLSQSDGRAVNFQQSSWKIPFCTQEAPAAKKAWRAPPPGFERHHVSLLQQLQQERANLLHQLNSVQCSDHIIEDSSISDRIVSSTGYVCRPSQKIGSFECPNWHSEVANGNHGYTQQPIKRRIMAESSHFLHTTVLPHSPTEQNPCMRSSRHSIGPPSEEHREVDLTTLYQDDWMGERVLWRSLPTTFGTPELGDPVHGLAECDPLAPMSLGPGMSASYYGPKRPQVHRLSTKVEMVYSLLSMLGTHDKEDLSRTLLTMSGSQESCIAMRQSGCLPLLIQLLHGGSKKRDTTVQAEEETCTEQRQVIRELRSRAGQALHNVVHAHPDDKRGRREARVLRLLEQIRDYCDYLRDMEAGIVELNQNDTGDQHPGPAIAALMKLSFDEEHRHAMCQLGGLQAIAELIQVDHECHGSTSDHYCVTLRRYAGMALTNLTFGDGTNKALLCSMKPFMQALVAQLHSPSEDLRQVTASVLRNLSWRADSTSRETLREVGAVSLLMKASMEANKESTLKSILSALWNLSAHCTSNKADICAVDGALAFLVSTLTYRSQSKTLAIVENGGGILRNISSYIALHEEHRAVLRKHNCLQVLLQQLSSPSLTVVSNACGSLWNLSAHCIEDQATLWQMGAVGMLRNLVHSKHRMISMGSSAALKNLLSVKHTLKQEVVGGDCDGRNNNNDDDNGNDNLPSLLVRKQKALEADIDENLTETCDNIDSPQTSPTFERRFVLGEELSQEAFDRSRPYLPGRMYHSVSGDRVPRSDSRDSIGSTHSEPTHFRPPRSIFTRRHRLGRYSLERCSKVEWHPPLRGGDVPAYGMNLNLAIGQRADIPPPPPPGMPTTNGYITEMPYFENGHGRHFQQKRRSRDEDIEVTAGLLEFDDVQEADNEEDLCGGRLYYNAPGNGDICASEQKHFETDERNTSFLGQVHRAEEHGALFCRPLGVSHGRSRHRGSSEDTVILTDLASLEDGVEHPNGRPSKLREAENEEKEENECGSTSDECVPDTEAPPTEKCIVAEGPEICDTLSCTGARTGKANGITSLHHRSSGIPVKSTVPRTSKEILVPCSSVPAHGGQPSAAGTHNTTSGSSAMRHGAPTDSISSSIPPCQKVHPQHANEDDQVHSVAHSLPVQWEGSVLQNCSGDQAGHPHSRASHSQPAPIASKRSTSHCCGYGHSPAVPSLHDYIFGKKKSGTKPQVATKPGQQFYDHNCDAESHQDGTLPAHTADASLLRSSTRGSSAMGWNSTSGDASTSTQSPYTRYSSSRGDACQMEIPAQRSLHAHPVARLGMRTFPAPAGTPADVSVPPRSRSTSTEGSTSGRSGSSSPNRSTASVREATCPRLQPHLRHKEKVAVKLRKTESNMGLAYPSQPHLPSDSEEKGKEDERAKEKSHRESTGEDSLQSTFDEATWNPSSSSSQTSSTVKAFEFSSSTSTGSPLPSEMSRTSCDETLVAAPKCSPPRVKELLHDIKALRSADDEMMRSTTSCTSDLENTKPPSVMGDLLSMSMTSSGLSDNVSSNGKNGKAHKTRRSRLPGRMRHAFSGSQESPKSGTDSDLLEFVGPPSIMGSIESLSFRSRNGHSDDLDRINPPSTMDDLSMSGSYASLNSVSSNEDNSSPMEGAGDKGKRGGDMSERLNAAANLAHVYTRELNSIMNGSVRSSSGTSEMLEHVQPPSVYNDINEVTYEDITELGSDGFLSDIDYEEDLPKDEDTPLPSTETLKLPQISSLMREEHFGDSTENLVSACVDSEPFEPDDEAAALDSVMEGHDQTFVVDVGSGKRIEKNDVGCVQREVNAMLPDSLLLSNYNYRLEDETFSLVSNDSDLGNPEEILEIVEQVVGDVKHEESKPSSSKGPRIVKPLNRDTIKQMQEKKEAEKVVQPPGIRGRGRLPQPLQLRRTSSPKQSQSPPPAATAIKHTKASALRASQNQRSSSAGPKTPKSASPNRFVWTAPNSPGGRPSNSRLGAQTSTASSRLAMSNTCAKPATRPKSLESVDTKVLEGISTVTPAPLVRQGTFTKESPTGSIQGIADKITGDTPLETKPSQSAARTSTTKSAATPCLRRGLGKSSTAPNVGRNNVAMAQKRRTIPLSPSSHSLGKVGEDRRAVYARSWSSGGIGGVRTERSSSATSLASQSCSSASPVPRKPAVPKKDAVASRIASLWRKDTPRKETSVVTREASAGAGKAGAKKGGIGSRTAFPEQPAAPPSPLCRSSTFEKLTDVGTDRAETVTSNAGPSKTASQSNNVDTTPRISSARKPAVRPTGLFRNPNEPSSTGQRHNSKIAGPMVSPSLSQSSKDGCRPTVGLRSPGSNIPNLQSPRTLAGGSDSKGSSPASAIVSPFSYKPRTPTTPSGTRSLIPAPVKFAARCSLDHEVQVQ